MSSSDKKTGLGSKAFFQNRSQTETKKSEQEKKPEKVRTTVSLYTDTMAGLEALKVEARRVTGEKVTYSDVLNEAIQDLMKKKGISFDDA